MAIEADNAIIGGGYIGLDMELGWMS